MKLRYSIYVITICILLSASKLFSQTLTDSLVAHYPFDGNAMDISGNGNNGTQFGPIQVSDRFGNANSAYLFDGTSDFISYNAVSKFKPSGFPMSISMWVKSNDNSGIGTVFKNDVVIDIYTGIWLQIHSLTGKIEISYGDGGTTDAFHRKTKLGSTNVNDNQWHFIAAVIRGPSDMDIWIDCQYDVGTYSGTGGSLTYSNNGGSSGYYDVVAGTEYYGGVIDDIRFYKRELTQTDLQALYIFPQPYINPLIQNFALGSDTSLCGLTSLTLSTNVTFPGITYNWSTNSTTSSTNVLTPGIYWLEVSDNCNQKTDTIIVNNSNILIQTSNDTTICSGSPLTLSVNGNASNYTWTNNGVTYNGNSLNINPTTNTVYYVNGNVGTCQSQTDSIVINVITSVGPVGFSSTGTICENNNFTFTNTSVTGLNYFWNFGDPISGSSNFSTNYNGTHNYNNAGTYLVELLVVSSCGTDSISQSISVINAPTVTISNNQTICQGDQVTMVASGGNSYQWSNNILSTNDSVTLTPLVNSTYYVQAIANGCISNPDSIQIQITPLPVIQILGDTIMCNGSQLELIASGNAQNYSWTGGVISSNDTITVSPVIATEYILVGSSQNCFSIPDTIEVNILNFPVASFSFNGPYCLTSAIQFTNNSTQASSFNWNFGDPSSSTNISTLTNPNHSFNNIGNHVITMQAINICGVDTDVQSLIIGTGPDVNLGPDSTVCSGSIIDLTIPVGSIFLWTGSITANTNTITDTLWGNSTYIAQASDGVCFGFPDTIQINVTSPPDVNITGNNLVCVGDSVQLFGYGATSFIWHGSVVSNANSVVVSPISDTEYYLTGYIGACTSTDTFHLDVLQKAEAIFSFQIDTCLSQIELINNSVGGSQYLWNFDNQESEIRNPNFQINNFQAQTLQLIVNPNTQCADTSFAYLDLNDLPQNNLFIPNTFTPNNDEINDVYTLKSSINCQPILIYIYNRWGECIYKLESSIIEWNGKYENLDVPQGVYFYLIEHHKKEYYGTITVLR